MNKVCNQIYGFDAPGGTSGYTLTRPGENWYLAGQVTGSGHESEITKLLMTARPGDVLQFKNSYATWQHTVMVYAVDNNGISIYDYVDKHGARLRTYEWSKVCTRGETGIGAFNKDSYGISLYRAVCYVLPLSGCTLNVCGYGYEYDGQEHTPLIDVRCGIRGCAQLNAGTDYTIKFTGDRTLPGTVSYTINGTGGCTGALSGCYTIQPRRISPRIEALPSGDMPAVHISWVADKTVDGYQIQSCAAPDFARETNTYTIEGSATTEQTVLAYDGFFRMRSYVLSGNAIIYGEWCAPKTP